MKRKKNFEWAFNKKKKFPAAPQEAVWGKSLAKEIWYEEKLYEEA